MPNVKVEIYTWMAKKHEVRVRQRTLLDVGLHNLWCWNTIKVVKLWRITLEKRATRTG